MRLCVCSPSHLLYLATGLALGLLLAALSDLLYTTSPQGDLCGGRVVVSGRERGCVCGRKMERLKHLARIALYQGSMWENTSVAPHEPTAAPEEVEELKAFLYPSDESPIVNYKQMKKKAYKPGSRKEPERLREEYIFKQDLFVGVLTQQSYLPTRAKALYETWGKEVDKIVFFVGEDCNISSDLSYLPIVKLRGIPDQVYPPLKKTFAVMSYMYEHYVNDFNWFIRADDDMYVRTRKLKDLLHKLHPYESVYLGRAGTGRKEDLQRLRLLAHERYCMGGPGIILSVGALRQVGPHLDNCLKAVLYHAQHTQSDWSDDDVEVGRCISRKINVQCSSSLESRTYFQFDYDGDTLNPLTLWTKPELQELITVHPIKQPDNMRSLHHFYTTLEFESLYDQLYSLVGYLNALCGTLPPHAAPPPSTSAGCDLKLPPHHFNSSSIFSNIGALPNYLVTQTQVPYIHNPRNKFDLSPWIRFNNSLVQDINGVSPQHAPPTSFKSEMTHILNLIGRYISTQGAERRKPQITHVIDGYTRFNPHLGREYILTLRVAHQGGGGARGRPEYKRYHLVRELQPRLSVIEEHVALPTSPTVHVLLPLSKVDERLSGFLTSYSQNGLRLRDNQLHLVIIVFSDSVANSVEGELKRFSQESSYTVSVTVAVSEGSYSRLKAIEVGMAALEEDTSLVFLADVDVRFGRSFFRRCRSNAMLNQRVYFPVAFWLYNSQYRQPSSFDGGRGDPPVTSWSGLWASYNFWLVCIHKQDYNMIGGYRDSKYSVELFERASKSQLEVMQAPDPGLYHLWSEKLCKELKGSSRRDICQRLKKTGMVDRAELSDYLGELGNVRDSFDLEGHTPS